MVTLRPSIQPLTLHPPHPTPLNSLTLIPFPTRIPPTHVILAQETSPRGEKKDTKSVRGFAIPPFNESEIIGLPFRHSMQLKS